MSTVTQFYLDDVWCIFHHNIEDTSWTYDSYTRLSIISSAEEFWSVHEQLAQYLPYNLFFVMREHSFPCWDDATNINGGCISVRVPIRNVDAYWQKLCAYLLCERIADREYVNGISVSPKHTWSIFKVWLSKEVNVKEVTLPAGYVGDILYKSNRDNINGDRAKTC